MNPTLLERKRRVLMPCLHHFFGEDPIELVAGDGLWVTDRAGRRYLDFYSGVAVTNLGHCHPEVAAAAARQMATLQHTTTIHLTEPMIALAERLVAHAPGALRRVFFCADGSGANEGAMVAARLATGRSDFIALDGSLHGRTSLTMAATGLPMWRADPFSPPCVHHLPSPADAEPAAHAAALRALIDRVGAGRIAALIAEPIQGNGGIIVPPPRYFGALQEVLREHGILLIVDEAQTGFCRSGRWFGIEHWDVAPDLMSVAKAMANGLPAAAWLATEDVASSFTRPAASTFGGNLVAMAAGLKTIEIMERDHLDDRAARLGGRLRGALEELARGDTRLRRARGLGLMVGVDLTDEEGRPDGRACESLLVELRRRGLLAGKTGPQRNVLTLLPPLILEDAQLEGAIDRLAEALAATRGADATC